MTGSIVTRKLKDGSKRYDVSWRSNGKQYWKTFAKKRAAENFLNRTVQAVHEGTWQPVRPLLMGELLDKWESDWLHVHVSLGRQKASTAQIYKCIIRRHFRPAFHNVRSDQLSAEVTNRWIKGLADQIAQGKLSPRTYNGIVVLFQSILTWARHRSRRYLQHNPLEEWKALPKGRPEREFLQPDELQRLLAAAGESSPDDTILKLLAYTGLRRGEAFGLKWDDVEWNAGAPGGRLYVRRGIYKGQISTPKTAAGFRVVDIPQSLLDVLTAHKIEYPPLDENFIFRNRSGSPIDPDDFHRRRLPAVLERAGLRHLGLHCLRHTYVATLINAGENVKYISKQVGHSSISMTMDLYGHVFRDTSTAAMGRLNALITGASSPGLSNAHQTDPAKTPLNTSEQEETGIARTR